VKNLLSAQTLQWLWAAWMLYWFVNSLNVRRTVRREPTFRRWSTILVMISAAVLLGYTGLQLGILEHRFVPDNDEIRAVGLLLTIFGLAITIWARIHLGQFWSARVTLKEGHELIQSGPYSLVRHPIYSGILLAVFGSALFIGEWRALLGVCLVWFAHTLKARREEKLLSEQFGDTFAKYRQRTGALLPRLFS
jgi:protein-S-isoprenylcysteine O-methyltransferase Ste14